jgi:hypothetical protein
MVLVRPEPEQVADGSATMAAEPEFDLAGVSDVTSPVARGDVSPDDRSGIMATVTQP